MLLYTLTSLAFGQETVGPHASCDHTTIAAAVAAAATTDTIAIQPGTYKENLGNIHKNLTFMGADASCAASATVTGVVIDAENNGRVATFTGANVTFINISLINGSGQTQPSTGITVGGILGLSSSTVTLDGAYLANGSAQRGGAIFLEDFVSAVIMPGSTNGSWPNSHGAIFASNTATEFGGAIYCDFGTLTVVEAEFALNSAADGGAIFSDQCQIDLNPVMDDGVWFHDNSAIASGGSAGQGGAIRVVDDRNDRMLTFGPGVAGTTAFHSNSARDGGAISATKSTIELSPTGITVLQAEFLTNSAGNVGGGISLIDPVRDWTFDTVHMEGNFATGIGGAISVLESEVGDLTVSNSTLWGNTSLDSGGAIFAKSVDTFLLRGTQLAGNLSTLSGAGAFVVESDAVLVDMGSEFVDNAAGASGGGLFVQSVPTVGVSGTTFEDNAVTQPNQVGGGAFIDQDDATSLAVTITDSPFEHNQAAFGGGLFVSGERSPIDPSSLTMVNVDFLANLASGSGGGVALRDLDVVSYSADTTCTDVFPMSYCSHVEGNRGTAMTVSSSGSVTIDQVTFSRNSGVMATEAAALGLGPGVSTEVTNSLFFCNGISQGPTFNPPTVIASGTGNTTSFLSSTLAENNGPAIRWAGTASGNFSQSIEQLNLSGIEVLPGSSVTRTCFNAPPPSVGGALVTDVAPALNNTTNLFVAPAGGVVYASCPFTPSPNYDLDTLSSPPSASWEACPAGVNDRPDLIGRPLTGAPDQGALEPM